MTINHENQKNLVPYLFECFKINLSSLTKVSIMVSLLSQPFMYFEIMFNLLDSAYTNYRGAMFVFALR